MAQSVATENSDSDDNFILLQLCINKRYNLTENIDPKQDVWKLAQLNANDINMNDLTDEIKHAFKFKKSFKQLFTNIDKWEWNIYSYEATKAALTIEEDDDLQTEVDVFVGSDNASEEGSSTNKEKYLKLRVVFHPREEIKDDITAETNNENMAEDSKINKKQFSPGGPFLGSNVGSINDTSAIPCEQCGKHISFNEYQNHQLAHMVSEQFVAEYKTKKSTVKAEIKKSNLICFCGERFIFVNAKQAYHGQFESCDVCHMVCKYHLYYCPENFHGKGFCLCHKCGAKLINEAAKTNTVSDIIPEQFKDPITDKIMKNPIMIVSSAQIYDEITVEKMLELRLGYDIINGISFSNAWPALFERRVDIKNRIDVFLREHPEFESQVIEKDDENNFLYRFLLKKQRYHTELENKVFEAHANHSNLNHTAKQIFKPLHQKKKEEQKLSEFAQEHLTLRLKAKQIYDKVEIKDRGWLFKKQHNCFLGSEAVQVIIDLKMANDEETAVSFGNKLMQHDIIWHVSNEHEFKNEKERYIFVEDFSVFAEKDTDTAGIIYDDKIILDPDIPVVCIMGPSRNGKSTIVNDILGVKNACKVSFSSNVALTKGAWITKYSMDEKNRMSDYKYDNEAEFYLLDMEGLSHDVTKFTKQLFYACYAISNVIVWNDKNVASDEFKRLMSKLKEEMKTVAISDNKPSFLYLQRDAGGFNYDPHVSFEEYINKHDSFKWLRDMNIFSSLSGYELPQPSFDKNNRKGELNFSSKPENRKLLTPLIEKIIDISSTSCRFAYDTYELKKQVDHINKSTAFNMTEISVGNNKILRLFSLDDGEFRRSQMIYAACEFNWDHKKLKTAFQEEAKKVKSILNGIDVVDYKVMTVLEKNQKEVYERIKNKKRTSYKEVAAKAGAYGGLALYAGGSIAFGVATAGLGALAGVMIGGMVMGSSGGYWMAKNKYKLTKKEVRDFATNGYLEFSLGPLDEEID